MLHRAEETLRLEFNPPSIGLGSLSLMLSFGVGWCITLSKWQEAIGLSFIFLVVFIIWLGLKSEVLMVSSTGLTYQKGKRKPCDVPFEDISTLRVLPWVHCEPETRLTFCTYRLEIDTRMGSCLRLGFELSELEFWQVVEYLERYQPTLAHVLKTEAGLFNHD